MSTKKKSYTAGLLPGPSFGPSPANEAAGQCCDETLSVKFPSAAMPVNADRWIHWSIGMRCRTCMYFVEKHGTMPIRADQDHLGRCRRHAPTMNGWPVMFEGDWCGDHKLDENKR